MKTCKANDVPVGAFVEFDARQMLVVDDDTIRNGIEKWIRGEIDGLCTTYVTNMSELFCDQTDFNQPIGDWDVVNVTDMSSMFYNAKSFNKPIVNWSVCNVTDMNRMFIGAESFNHPLNDWDVSNVTDMAVMFGDAESFNQDISRWDTSNVLDMSYMFCNADSFDERYLNDWCCYSVDEGLHWSDREE